MNMSFQEKSAWGSLVALGLVSYWYFPAAFAAAGSSGAAGDLIAISIGCVVAIIVIEIIYHLIIAGGAGNVTDERDALINIKAERIAGFILAAGLVTLVGRIIAVEAMAPSETMGALTIAIWILLVLTVAEISKLASQVWYYRAGA